MDNSGQHRQESKELQDSWKRKILRMSKKPTVEELEKLLNDPEEHPIEILPDGSIKVDRRRKGKGFIKTIKRDVAGYY